MRKRLIFLIAVIVASSAYSCKRKSESKGSTPVDYALTIDPSISYQTIHNFGASDCWSGQFWGSWSTQKVDSIADLLFSKQLDKQGNPKGIGLSCWRYNIGAGSAEQGEESEINDPWRRAPGILTTDDSMSLKNQQAQINIVRKALERGCETTIAFVNSPPIEVTENGKAFSSNGVKGNLSKDNQQSYADYLTKFLFKMKQEGIDFDYVSPFNEPQWDWQRKKNGLASQEGSPWTNSEIADICRLLNESLEKEQLHTEIEITECAQMDYLYALKNKPQSGNQIKEFFSTKSSNYIGNLSRMANKVGGHSYFTTWPLEKSKTVRETVKEEINKYNNLEFWMTEYCILENNKQIKGGKRDLGINTALYVSRVIHDDLCFANASAWQWWTALSPYNYKDGLIYIDKKEMDGRIYPSKTLWALGNYSRFITPESKRIKLECASTKKVEQRDEFFCSAFETKNEEIIVVCTNRKSEKQNCRIHIDGQESDGTLWITSSKKDLEYSGKIQNNTCITIPSKSVVTIQFEN